MSGTRPRGYAAKKLTGVTLGMNPSANRDPRGSPARAGGGSGKPGAAGPKGTLASLVKAHCPSVYGLRLPSRPSYPNQFV